MTFNNRNRIINIAVGITFALSLVLLVFSFIPNPALEQVVSNVINSRKLVQRVLAVVLLVTTYNLYKRKRVAWIMTIVLLGINMAGHLFRAHHTVGLVIIILEALVLLVLLIFTRDFNRASDKRALGVGIIFVLMGLYAIFLSASSIYFDDTNIFDPSGGLSFGQCLLQTFQVIFVAGNVKDAGVATHPEFNTFVFWFSWICIIAALGFAVKPFLEKRRTTSSELEHARWLVQKYGQNPLSYLTLEDDKTLHFGKNVDGVVAYGVVDDVVVVGGDPICADTDFPVLLEEFRDFCKNSAFSLVFMGITDYYIEEYKRLGLGTIKCGEEARFDLTEFTMQGGKIAKVRANVNKATKAGVTVHEYRPLEKRDDAIEGAINAVSDDWLREKTAVSCPLPWAVWVWITLWTSATFTPKMRRASWLASLFLSPLRAWTATTQMSREGLRTPPGVSMRSLWLRLFRSLRRRGSIGRPWAWRPWPTCPRRESQRALRPGCWNLSMKTSTRFMGLRSFTAQRSNIILSGCRVILLSCLEL